MRIRTRALGLLGLALLAPACAPLRGGDAEDPLAERARIELGEQSGSPEVATLLEEAVDAGTFPGAVAVWGSLDATHWATS